MNTASKFLLVLGLIAGNAGAAVSPDNAPLAPLNPTAISAADRLLPGAQATETIQVEPSVAERLRQIETYHEAISKLETEYGAYDAQIGQQLSGLAKAYQALGKHGEAIDLLSRSLHIERLNNGLYDLGQVDTLLQLTESHMALKNWEELNQVNKYIFWLYRRNYNEESPELLPALYRLGDWHLTAFANTVDVDSTMLNHLVSARKLYTLATRIIEKNYSANDPRMIEPLQNLMLTSYYFKTYRKEPVRGLSINMSAAPEQPLAPIGGTAEDYFIQNSYRHGKQAMEEIIAIYEKNSNLPVKGYAAALVDLGDWYMMFDRWSAAYDTYKQAHLLLEANPSEDAKQQLDELFKYPRALPRYQPNPLPLEGSDNDERLAILKLDVSDTGRPVNVEVIETQPEVDSSVRYKARKNVISRRFRPRFEDGEPVSTEGFLLRLKFYEGSTIFNAEG